MESEHTWTPIDGNKQRQGFYFVKTSESQVLLAEWRERDKSQGKLWWQYVTSGASTEKKPVPLLGMLYSAPASKQVVDEYLSSLQTVLEKIEQAYQAYCSSTQLYLQYVRKIPECRALKVGDQVERGSLKDCEVVALRDEGQVVIHQYANISSNYGQPIDHGIAYKAARWLDVTKKLEDEPVSQVLDSPLYNSFVTSTLTSLLFKMRAWLNGSPDYQRGYAWTNKDKQRYLESLFQGRDLGRFMLVIRAYPFPDELLDGKQRLSCLMDFVAGDLDYNGTFWHQLPRLDRQRIAQRSVQYAEIDGARHSRVQLLQIFLAVNCAGVPQSEEHLDHVRALLAQDLKKGNK